ncbi:carbamoyltransferase HypF [Alteribacter aurantiacus]|uniref:carbamoyltransferase HypF n=1 Tax=Alteribacter aurantiacus TaxID=254410 RepID=UPI00040D6296|nr:carbamoyltransferase HypF [Alteribacter aurantiacus]
MQRAVRVVVKGRVQGVGFRPFIYGLASRLNIKGTVQNNVDGVIIIGEGEWNNLLQFNGQIKESAPRLSRIEYVAVDDITYKGYEEFSIIPSVATGKEVSLISPDAAVCEDCINEMNNPLDRRYKFPFINCTQCGPRYSIIHKLPYDRPYTTMASFHMCTVCREEYTDPTNRRHHAQPICCAQCGPRLELRMSNGQVCEGEEAINKAILLLKSNKIVAVKGIGGYHLACNARAEEPINQLRKVKHRPKRPFAVMADCLETVMEMCEMTDVEEAVLNSSEMPITLLKKKPSYPLSDCIAPRLSTLGVMLPYTPLHHLLFREGLNGLVMTSANVSGSPILYKDDDCSFNQLRALSDAILTHDRPIYRPIDDSVVQCERDQITLLRRARGYAPDPLKTYAPVDSILALGGNQKNAFALGVGSHIFVSPHIGDLDHEEMVGAFREHLAHYKKWLGFKEKYVVIDKHPLYETNRLARELGSNVLKVQHHHAHHVSCMEEHGLKKPTLGIILDGTGYGNDGHVWGFELLYGDKGSFERLGHLRYTPLPGGEKAVKEPWRNAVGMLINSFSQEGRELACALFPDRKREIDLIENMVKKGVNTPLGGTCGRLFDAVSAMLGVCSVSTYEGEAAIKLAEFGQDQAKKGEHYPFQIHDLNGTIQLDFSSGLYEIASDRLSMKPTRTIAQAFHRTVVEMSVQMVMSAVKKRPDLNRNVVLSGGSFQNFFLRDELKKELSERGFEVFTHRLIPCHDGGLSVGQLIIASEWISRQSAKKGSEKDVYRSPS